MKLNVYLVFSYSEDRNTDEILVQGFSQSFPTPKEFKYIFDGRENFWYIILLFG